jgi:hydrogenase maturation factor
MCVVAWGYRTAWVASLFMDDRALAFGDWVLVVGGQTLKRLDADAATAMNTALGIPSGATPDEGATA